DTAAGIASVDLPQATQAAPVAETVQPQPQPELATGLAIPMAAAAAQLFPIEPANKELLAQDMPVTQFVELLVSREQYLDAIRVVAHAMAKRSAVDWAGRCVRAAVGEDLSPMETAAMSAAEAWVADPSEDHRRQAGTAAEGA